MQFENVIPKGKNPPDIPGERVQYLGANLVCMHCHMPPPPPTIIKR